MRRALLALVALLIAVAPASAQAQTEEMVALGDSYAAGPLIPAPIPPFGCLKSTSNYGRLASIQLGASPYRDATCSGAETEDMTAPQGVSPRPNPPQFDRLRPTTTLVTITIGGNDIGFSGIAEDCFSPDNTGTPCQDTYVAPDGTDEISQNIAETRPKVDAVLQGIRQRTSPTTQILVVNYAAILPHTGDTGCWPIIPISDDDVPYVRSKQEELNQMLADSAAANGAQLVDWYAASVGHDACQPPGLKWVEGAIPTSAAAPVHPNLLGMQGAASLVVAAAQAG
jgi:lysophospholipase L1-like esterase